MTWTRVRGHALLAYDALPLDDAGVTCVGLCTVTPLLHRSGAAAVPEMPPSPPGHKPPGWVGGVVLLLEERRNRLGAIRVAAAVCVCSVSPLGHEDEPPRLTGHGGFVVDEGKALLLLARADALPVTPRPHPPRLPTRAV
jgi:hypothetical protein